MTAFDDAIHVFPKMPGDIVIHRGVVISVGDAGRLLEHLENFTIATMTNASQDTK